MPSGNKPLPEPMLTQMYVAISTFGHNELMIIRALTLLLSCMRVYFPESCVLMHICSDNACGID